MTIAIPKHKTPVQADITKTMVLIYGPPKVGKSTFAASAKRPLFIPTEPGLNHLNVFKITEKTHIETYQELHQAYVALHKAKQAGTLNFAPIVIDTVGRMVDLCEEEAKRKTGAENLGDVPHGGGWAVRNTLIKDLLFRFSGLGQGLMLLCHSKLLEEDTPRGKRISHVPALSGSVALAVMGHVDVVGFAYPDADGNPKLYTKPHKSYQAGDRTGRLPDAMDLDYEAFKKAYETGAKTK
jgi:hypothetical protein